MSGKIRSTPGRSACGEGDAEIDRQPGAVVGAAVAIEAEVHADLADPAERQEDQLVLSARAACRLSRRRARKTSPAPIVCRRPSSPTRDQPARPRRAPRSARRSRRSARLTADRLADADGARQPAGADRGEARCRGPTARVPRPCASASRPNSASASTGRPAAAKSPAAWPVADLRMRDAIDADADDDGKGAGRQAVPPSTRMPATFGRSSKQIVRPFQRQPLGRLPARQGRSTA